MINLPWGCIKNKNGEWIVFNAGRLNLGFHDRHRYAADFPVSAKYTGLTEKLIKKLVDESMIDRDVDGKIFRFYLYNKDEIGYTNDNAELNEYFKRLMQLSKLKKKD